MRKGDLIDRLSTLLDDVERKYKSSNGPAKDKWSAVAGHLEYALQRARHDY